MTDADWQPHQYERFKEQRAQPFWDLAELVDPVAIGRWVDLGCGTGELTAALAARLDGSACLGLDNSPNMLAAAERFGSGTVEFQHADIASWTSAGDTDLVFANASLQWVADHTAVLERWTTALRPGGQLAVQVPYNHDHPSHLASSEVAITEPFLSAMGGAPPPDPVAVNVLAPEAYSALLFELGFDQQHVRLQVYPHVMASSADVVEWTKGTSLTRFFKVLPTEMHEPFIAAYRAELLRRIGNVSPYFYAFKRILIWGRLP